MMDLNSFKLIREQYLAGNLSKDNNESLYEYFDVKYSDDELNEGIISGVVSWFKRNFSPKASKLRALGREYFEWLMAEYNAEYKGGKEETKLEKFLRKEDISVDIKDKVMQVAGDDKDYQDLANKILLESRLDAKKQFSSKILGGDSRLARMFGDKYDKASTVTKSKLSSLSKNDQASFRTKVKNLTDKIKKDGVKETVAKNIAAGIAIFFVNRIKDKNDYTDDQMESEYKHGEKEAGISSLIEAYQTRGVRSFEGDKELDKKSFTFNTLIDYIDSAKEELKNVGLDNPDKTTGFLIFYLNLSKPESRKTFLNELKDGIKSKDESKIQEISASLYDTVEEAYKTGDRVQEIMLHRLNKLKAEWKHESSTSKPADKTGTEKTTSTTDKTDTDKKETKTDSETGEEKKGDKEEQVDDKKYPTTDKLKEDIEKSDKLINVIDAVILTVASTMKSSGGEGYSLSERISKSKSFKEFGLDNVFRVDNKNHLVDKNINDKMIEKAKNYLDGGLAVDDISSTKYDKAKVDEAVKSLKEDLTRTVNMYKNEIEKSESDAIEAFYNAANISRFFLAKELSEKPLTEEEIKEKFMFILDKKIGIAELETKKTTPE